MGILDKVFGGGDDKRRANEPSTPRSPTPGTARTAPDRPVADFSDVSASSSSTPMETERSYTVKAGDSLSRIAEREYGDASQWRRIYEANRQTISNPDLIHPGQVLTIPGNS